MSRANATVATRLAPKRRSHRNLALAIAAGVLLLRVLADGGETDVALEAAKARSWEAIDLEGLADSIHHALMKYEHETAPYARYRPEEIVHIAENLLAWQNGDGGWPGNRDWLKMFSAAELAALPHGRPGRSSAPSMLDNRNTWAQIDYLARTRRRTGLSRYDESIVRGLKYLLDTQHASGGWRGTDVDAITFNDDVMVGTLRTLRSAAEDDALFGFLEARLRRLAAQAYARGIACILKCQIVVAGRLTAWCQQHSHETFEPVWARAFEPPSITAGESVDVVRLLMEVEQPPPEIVRSIDAAVAWFERVAIRGIRVDKVPAPPIRFRNHWCDFDRVVVEDPEARPIWTRFYDLVTEEPLFCTRDRKITSDYTEVGRERRTGYAYYGYWPAPLLAGEHARWRRKLSRPPSPGTPAAGEAVKGTP